VKRVQRVQRVKDTQRIPSAPADRYDTSVSALPGILALLAAACGWYYMFYSKAAQRLSGIEGPEVNQKRVRLRRINGFIMLLFGVCFYAGIYSVDHTRPVLFLLIWLGVVLLLFAIVALALLDLRITARLRRKR
jgi:hypothetical protein